MNFSRAAVFLQGPSLTDQDFLNSCQNNGHFPSTIVIFHPFRKTIITSDAI
jgi:hypothetical protein